MDTIDLKLLNLLQQRTKLSGEIGRAKRRHGAEIYVPDRERELLARVAGLAGGKLPSEAVAAIFREIVSSSRAAQGQAPIGVLHASAETVLLPARWHFGACDRFVTKRSWRELARELTAGRLAVALLTLADLGAILRGGPSRAAFLSGLCIVGDFAIDLKVNAPLDQRVFIVKPRKKEMSGSQALILIKCKITANAIKSLLTAMPNRPLHLEHATLFGSQGRSEGTLVRLTFAKGMVDARRSLDFLLSSGMTTSIVGIYPGGEDYGG